MCRKPHACGIGAAVPAAIAGAALAALIFAASFALPVQETPALRRALVDIPAAALALIGAPDLAWRAVAGEKL